MKDLHGLHLAGLFSFKTKTIYLDSGIPLNCLWFMSAVRHQEEQHEKAVCATMQTRCKRLLAGDFCLGCPSVTGGEKPHPTKCSKGAGKSFCALAIVLPTGHVRSLREGNAHMKAGLAGGARRVEL